MAKARVQLRKCESFTGRGGVAWKKNQARTLTRQSEIDYYKLHPEFIVTILAEPKAAPKPKAPADTGDEGKGKTDGDPSKPSESKLGRMSKPELVDYAADTYGLALDEDEMPKDDMVKAILQAQG